MRDVLRAGTDVDCGSFVGKNAQSALTKKTITEADIDVRLKLLFKVRMRLQHFDPPGALQQIPTSDICSSYAKALAADGPAQSCALLKNAGNTLPLKKGANVAVIGPNANLSSADAGYYGPHNVCDGKFWTSIDAVTAYAGKTTSCAGVPTVKSNDTSGIAAAVAMAAAADDVVLVVGTDLTWAAEGHDADPVHGITFTAAQMMLIAKCAAAAKKPITVLTLTATPLDLTAVMANPKVGAIVHAGQPSVAAMGIGDVLFGKVSPAGRTIQTVYPSAYATQVSIFDFNMRPGPSAFPAPGCVCKTGTMPGCCPRGVNPGRTHRFYTGKAVVPFGFGLS